MSLIGYYLYTDNQIVYVINRAAICCFNWVTAIQLLAMNMDFTARKGCKQHLLSYSITPSITYTFIYNYKLSCDLSPFSISTHLQSNHTSLAYLQ